MAPNQREYYGSTTASTIDTKNTLSCPKAWLVNAPLFALEQYAIHSSIPKGWYRAASKIFSKFNDTELSAFKSKGQKGVDEFHRNFAEHTAAHKHFQNYENDLVDIDTVAAALMTLVYYFELYQTRRLEVRKNNPEPNAKYNTKIYEMESDFLSNHHFSINSLAYYYRQLCLKDQNHKTPDFDEKLIEANLNLIKNQQLPDKEEILKRLQDPIQSAQTGTNITSEIDDDLVQTEMQIPIEKFDHGKIYNFSGFEYDEAAEIMNSDDLCIIMSNLAESNVYEIKNIVQNHIDTTVDEENFSEKKSQIEKFRLILEVCQFVYNIAQAKNTALDYGPLQIEKYYVETLIKEFENLLDGIKQNLTPKQITKLQLRNSLAKVKSVLDKAAQKCVTISQISTVAPMSPSPSTVYPGSSSYQPNPSAKLSADPTMQNPTQAVPTQTVTVSTQPTQPSVAPVVPQPGAQWPSYPQLNFTGGIPQNFAAPTGGITTQNLSYSQAPAAQNFSSAPPNSANNQTNNNASTGNANNGNNCPNNGLNGSNSGPSGGPNGPNGGPNGPNGQNNGPNTPNPHQQPLPGQPPPGPPPPPPPGPSPPPAPPPGQSSSSTPMALYKTAPLYSAIPNATKWYMDKQYDLFNTTAQFYAQYGVTPYDVACGALTPKPFTKVNDLHPL